MKIHSIKNLTYFNLQTQISFKGEKRQNNTQIPPERILDTMNTNCVKIIPNIERGNKMNETDKFVKLRDEFSEDLDKVRLKNDIAAWNFYTDSSEENLKTYEESQDEFNKLFQNEETYNKFKKINKNQLPKHEQKQLKNILKSFDERLNSGKLFKQLEKKENEIAKKYNSYVPVINGKEVSKTEISKILQNEINPEIRKAAYTATIKGGDLIAEDLIEFVKLRNEFAKTKGYDNYFDYKVKEDYDTDAKFLNKLIDEVYIGAKDKIGNIQQKNYNELKDFYKTDKLKGYHYGLLLDTDPEKAVNNILENNDILEICKKTYQGMGFDIDKYMNEGKLILDLYPRKGKNTHGFCFGIDSGKDSRILANLRNDTNSIDTLNHELGHSMYDLGISRDLPIMDRCPSSSAVTEAVAMMMGDLLKKENILKDYVPKEELLSFKNSLKKDEANFVSKSLLIIDFEREFYKNPDQDPAKLWRDLRLKYRNQDHEANNEWATIPHYLSHPGYYQNYFRAALMKAQIYNHLHKTFGNITENENVAKYLIENLFSKGQSIEEYDLIKELTNNEFCAKDFIETL